MKTIICLGNKACEIGEYFESYGNYKVKLIDKDIEGDNCYSLVRQTSAEAYEQNVPVMSEFFSDISDDILFITSSDCEVLSCSLRILEQIKHKNISIFYLRTDRSFLSKNGVLQDRAAFNIFQEYTRSGLFKNIFLFDETLIDLFLDEAAVKDYFAAYLRFICDIIIYYELTKTEEAIIDNTFPASDPSRICTFGFYDLEKNEEHLTYNFNFVDTKNYHFFLSEETLNNDKKIMKNIKEKIKNKTLDNMQISYSIRKTDHQKDFCFVICFSKAIQQ